MDLDLCINVPKTCRVETVDLILLNICNITVFWLFLRRPWYHRALVNPAKAAVSNAYMDANGIGKVITISEAVFQALPKTASNISCGSLENLLGGCPCTRYGASESLMRCLFCITLPLLVRVQICYTVSHNLPLGRYLMAHHVIASLYVILCHDVSRFTLRLTSSRSMCQCALHALCYFVSLVYSKLFKDDIFFGSSREFKHYCWLSQPTYAYAVGSDFNWTL